MVRAGREKKVGSPSTTMTERDGAECGNDTKKPTRKVAAWSMKEGIVRRLVICT